jgi:hypothetical protein
MRRITPKEWIAKYKGQFDQGWDKLREQTLERQKKLGVVPADTKLAPKPEAIKDWDTLSATIVRPSNGGRLTTARSSELTPCRPDLMLGRKSLTVYDGMFAIPENASSAIDENEPSRSNPKPIKRYPGDYPEFALRQIGF